MSQKRDSSSVDIIAEPSKKAKTETSEEEDEVIIDLREKKYRGFIVLADFRTTQHDFFKKHEEKTIEEKRKLFDQEWPLCRIGTDEEAFPFRAKPLTKKPSGDEIRTMVGGNMERVMIDKILRDAGYKIMYVNEEGKMLEMEYNCDATAFARYKNDPLVGDVVVSK